jgi:hypothetical protein
LKSKELNVTGNIVQKRHLELLKGGSDNGSFNLGYSALKGNLHLVTVNILHKVMKDGEYTDEQFTAVMKQHWTTNTCRQTNLKKDLTKQV